MKATRREFLIGTGGFLAASALSAYGTAKKHVIVVGAGLSGLSTAYELALKGYRVTILEGRDRVGGRIFTLRKPFSDGLFCESGGELIGDGYKRMLEYSDKFNVDYEELTAEVETGGSVADLQDGIGRTAYLKGNLYPRGSVFNPHPYGLKGDEAKVLPPTLYGMNIRLMINEVRRKKRTISDFDKMSLADAMREKGVSEQAIKLMDISLNYNSIETVSAGGVLFDGGRRRGAGTVPIKFTGGNDLLTDALAENSKKNGVNIRLSSKVKRISQTGNGVKVSFVDKNGNGKTLKADKLVCTIPFKVLRNVEFAPCLPYQKTKAINELGYTRNTKVYFQTKFAEWDKRTLGSSIWTDTPVERIFSVTGKTGDEKGIFSAWTEGNGSKVLENMAPEKRVAFAREKFEEILPFMKGSVERTYTQSWTKDEFAGGSYSHLKVGQLTSVFPHIRTAVGNIHFAGEHTAVKFPGMEGALESAERVVAEITGG